uniref:Uncharacterized protein n=1 Tax=Vitis vinifera TaxID=29760 RepID=F6H4J5_VITVI
MESGSQAILRIVPFPTFIPISIAQICPRCIHGFFFLLKAICF